MKLLQKVSDASAWKLLVICVILLSVVYSTLTVVRHDHFQSGGFDLGLYDQAVWQYSKFIWPYNTVKARFILGDHLTLTLPLLAPVYWVVNDVRALLVVQATWVSASVIAVYLLTKHRKFSPFTALGISCVYSLFYGLQYGLFFDFHPVLLATGLIPWMLYFMETKRTKLFIVFLVLLVLTQENMGLALTSLGFIYIWKKEYRKLSLGFIFGGLAVSLLAAKAITIFSPTGFQYVPHLEFNPILFVRDLFNAPEKQQVWLYTLATFTFLPLLSPGAVMAVVFDLAQYFTTGPDFARMWSPFMHHRAILIVYLFLGALDGLAWIKRKKVNIENIVALLIVSALVQQFIFHYPLNKLTKADFWRTDSWTADNEKMIATIPPDMALATQQSLVPHLSHRKIMYLAWPRVHDFKEMPCGRVSCWWLDVDSHAQYLLIDSHPDEWLTMLLETPEHVKEALTDMEKLGKITPVRKIHDIGLYRINY